MNEALPEMAKVLPDELMQPLKTQELPPESNTLSVSLCFSYNDDLKQRQHPRVA